ncbi:chondroitin sulfate synthase 1-like isoform X2 [Eriocheir sinensis]|uniref:chondroitin sulfate synthase 1-like isoform X2 n=1 Tax=Eriocheir sinensis TaxID=95602 RepID=UPI0021C7ACB4|nr:chondroitin sulfate synthase 1-like isoform X2 [Eriocheir sinensis]XP_050695419.1 chondroitin sulfate synthase 1-like isoform X2 [Eriocheir sinensis]XP_050695420.1 chondroitin sulfate synthase 1-like isoform X2 [Eriocheir sinensis]
MNPYQYRAPPVGIELVPRPLKMRLTVRPLGVGSGSHARQGALGQLLGVSLGVVLGVILTSLMKHLILKPHLCLSRRTIPVYDDMNDVFRIVGLDKSKNVHNSAKNLVFVGVMTANKYLDNRAKAVYETWGKQLPGKIAFFSSETSTTDEDIPLIRLSGVDDSYPPQKKSFMMLKYMADHFADHFEYFMRSDDDVYVRPDRLELFLRSVNSTHPQFIGQAGKGTQDEIGLLALKTDENFCMGGPGVIMSRATLRQVAPHVRDCLKNLRSTHEDVEVGRCVRKYANVPCTWSYEMQSILYHNSSGTEAFTGPLKQREVHRAITLHPVKNHTHMYRLHSYVQGLGIRAAEGEVVRLSRELALTSQEAGLPAPRLDLPAAGTFVSHLGMDVSLQKWNAGLEEEVLPWDFVSRAAFQLGAANPRHKITSGYNEGLTDVIRDFMDIINRVSKERGRVIDFKEVLYGYIRWHPSLAMEYILDMLLLYKKYRGKKMTVPVRRHAYMQVPLGPLYVRELEQDRLLESVSPTSAIQEFVEVVVKSSLNDLQKLSYKVPSAEPSPPSLKPKKIYFILPLAGRLKTFQRFMDNFKSVCLEREENVVLVVVSFQPPLGEEDTRDHMEALVSSLHLDFPKTDMTVLQANTSFSRAMALELGANLCKESDLMLFIDVDMTFTAATLDRVRLHTRERLQIYYPIVFSEFDPQFTREGKTEGYDHSLKTSIMFLCEENYHHE